MFVTARSYFPQVRPDSKMDATSHIPLPLNFSTQWLPQICGTFYHQNIHQHSAEAVPNNVDSSSRLIDLAGPYGCFLTVYCFCCVCSFLERKISQASAEYEIYHLNNKYRHLLRLFSYLCMLRSDGRSPARGDRDSSRNFSVSIGQSMCH